jgi:galactokinase
VALALGFEGTSLALAQACQAAEHLASGVPCGIMDQLVSATGVAGHAVLIDCTTLTVAPTSLPPNAEIVVVHSGTARELATTAYAERRSAVEAAAEAVGRPLRLAEPADVEALADPVLRRRARHVVSENRRVLAFVAALSGADLDVAGQIMAESHASLRDDFEVSTRVLDLLVAELTATPGVFGSRLTGAGFGGCVIALCETGRGAALLAQYPNGWIVRAAGGARLTTVT